MVTIKDIAKRADVSVATVSYVLNNSRPVSPETKARVLRAIEELDYVPNAVARGLRIRKASTIGLILSDITNPFYPDLAKGCEDIAQTNGYTLIIMNTNDQEHRINSAVSQVKEGKVDGLIVASTLNRDEQALANLIKDGYPVVLAHRKITGLQVDSVVADNLSGAQSAVRHLISLGHKRIAMVTGIEESPVNNKRVQGYLGVMESEGLAIEPEWKISGDGKYESSYTAAVKLLNLAVEKRPTAIFCVNDIAALGVMDAVQDLGYKIPEDLAVVGFDDMFMSGTRSVQLTTVRIPRYEIGQQAVRLLLNRISQPDNYVPTEVILPVSLIIRKTCGAM